MLSLLALVALSTLETVHAWGSLGHETVAYIAQHYVTSHTEIWAQSVLNDTSTSYLANYATWADSYRYTTEGEFSAPYHYIDAEDNPPQTCNVDFDRDCGSEGCVVSAIANYTQRVQEPGVLDAEQVNYALRFLIHFVGDITQPLHDEALALGGNDIDVTFNGTDTNLHHIWDTNMPELLRGGYSLADAATWAENLTTEIDSGMFSKDKASWARGIDLNDPKTTAMGWAMDANRYVCSVVMPNNYTVLETGDLYPTYYDSTIGTVELQIAKAGFRLAKWLDGIAANQTTNSTRYAHAKAHARSTVDLSGKNLLPAPRELSPAKLRRAAVGWGCGHKH